MFDLRAPRRGAVLISLASLALVLAACAEGNGGAGGGTATVSGGNVDISADNLEFDVGTIEATAGEAFTVTLTNLEPMPHNFSVYTEEGGEEIAIGDFANNEGDTVTTSIPALDAGEYFFVCDVHPTEMTGTLVVEG
ncbi:MAG: cupredoxin domain-containing protein [Candidatus Limnocylindria bacterium]